jgi:hypothetical protein
VSIIQGAAFTFVVLIWCGIFVRHGISNRRIRSRIDRQRLREANWRAGDRRR